jgi:hypothetical protein
MQGLTICFGDHLSTADTSILAIVQKLAKYDEMAKEVRAFILSAQWIGYIMSAGLDHFFTCKSSLTGPKEIQRGDGDIP